MDLQLLIAVNIMVISGLAIVLGLLQRAKHQGWLIAVHAAILAAGALALALGWSQPGTIVAGLFIPLIIVPGTFTWLATRRSNMGENQAAAHYSRWAAVFHPSPNARLTAKLAQAQAHDDPDQRAAALRSLTEGMPPTQKAVSEALASRAEGRWGDVLGIIRSDATAGELLRGLEIRALGELGRVDEMVGVYTDNKTRLQGTDLRNSQLFVFAFCGRDRAVELLLDTKRPVFDAPTVAYWKTIAAFYSGNNRDRARAALENLAAADERPLTRAAAARHLSQAPVTERGVLSAASQAEIDALETRLVRDAPLRDMRLRRCPVTLALLIANSAMFALEASRGDAEDLQTLFDLGALWPPAVLQLGQWWRLATALFLHFGWAHFMINMLSLMALGRFVETAFGSLRMLVIYVIAGLGSMASVLGLMHTGMIEPSILVGASGAIMGLFGAIVARQLRNWMNSRDVLDRRGLIALSVIMAVQVAADFSIPNVSFAGHASGFAFGFIMALGLGSLMPKAGVIKTMKRSDRLVD